MLVGIRLYLGAINYQRSQTDQLSLPGNLDDLNKHLSESTQVLFAEIAQGSMSGEIVGSQHAKGHIPPMPVCCYSAKSINNAP